MKKSILLKRPLREKDFHIKTIAFTRRLIKFRSYNILIRVAKMRVKLSSKKNSYA